jgi:hypothetical protein
MSNIVKAKFLYFYLKMCILIIKLKAHTIKNLNLYDEIHKNQNNVQITKQHYERNK